MTVIKCFKILGIFQDYYYKRLPENIFCLINSLAKLNVCCFASRSNVYALENGAFSYSFKLTECCCEEVIVIIVTTGMNNIIHKEVDNLQSSPFDSTKQNIKRLKRNIHSSKLLSKL